MRNLARLRIDLPLMAGVVFALVGVAQFAVVTPMAMNSYAGGTRKNEEAQGYSWAENWLSDLGRSHAWNGKNNASSARLFNCSILVLGLSLIAFFFASYRAEDEASYAAFITAVAGTSSGLGLVGIGLTPFDLYHSFHIVALLIWIFSMLLVAASFSFQVIRSGGPTAVLMPLTSLTLLGIVLAYAFSNATDGVMTMQKLCVGISFCWFAVLAFRIALTAIVVIVETRTRYQIANEQADKYMQKIKRGHLRPFRRSD